MPIKIPGNLPAYDILSKENIFVMHEDRAFHQDIRPLKIAILNLMPTKIVTETQLLRLLGNSPLQVEIELLSTKSYISKNTPAHHLTNFYVTFEQIRDKKFDGLIITGAPVEKMDFEKVDYWEELKDIMLWSKKNVYCTLHICWGAMAGLYYHYGIKKNVMDRKLSGVFSHTINKRNLKIFRGFDDVFYAPHSRYGTIAKQDVLANEKLEIISESEEAGLYIVAAKNGRQLFITGHQEYDEETLKEEYQRDVKLGLSSSIPINYFKNDDPDQGAVCLWRSHANLFFNNWLNYYLYQETPYDINDIDVGPDKEIFNN